MTEEIRLVGSHELRALSATGKPKQLVGYAAKFNSLAQLPGFREQVMPGAFNRAIRSGADTKCLFNHDSNLVLGSSKAGTLKLADDGNGLKFICDLPATRTADEVHENVASGNLSGCSFGFIIGKDGQTWDEQRDADGTYFVRRSLTDIDRLTDVSVVSYPAYDDTEISARSTAVRAPVELRGIVDAKNARRSYVKPRNLVYVPSLEECLQVTLNAEARNKAEQQTVINRRKNLLNSLLQ